MRPSEVFLSATTLWLSTLACTPMPARADEALWSTRAALPAFHKISAEGHVDVTLTPGTSESVSITVPERQRRNMTVEVEDGVLTIRARAAENWRSRMSGKEVRIPRVTVVFRNIDTLDLSGAVKVHGSGIRAASLLLTVSGAASADLSAIDAEKMRVDGSGAIRAKLQGRAMRQEVSIAGASKYNAAGVASDTATVDVSGAGKATIRAERTLDVTISGAGAVEYLGDPRVTQHVSGVGRVQRAAAPAGSGS